MSDMHPKKLVSRYLRRKQADVSSDLKSLGHFLKRVLEHKERLRSQIQDMVDSVWEETKDLYQSRESLDEDEISQRVNEIRKKLDALYWKSTTNGFMEGFKKHRNNLQAASLTRTSSMTPERVEEFFRRLEDASSYIVSAGSDDFIDRTTLYDGYGFVWADPETGGRATQAIKREARRIAGDIDRFRIDSIVTPRENRPRKYREFSRSNLKGMREFYEMYGYKIDYTCHKQPAS